MAKKTPEGKVKDEIKKLLAAHGAYYTMPVKLGYGNNGELDFNVGINGFRLDIEAKAGKNTPSELQWQHIERLAKAGCPSLVIDEDNIRLLAIWLRKATADGATATHLRVRPLRVEGSKRVDKHVTF